MALLMALAYPLRGQVVLPDSVCCGLVMQATDIEVPAKGDTSVVASVSVVAEGPGDHWWLVASIGNIQMVPKGEAQSFREVSIAPGFASALIPVGDSMVAFDMQAELLVVFDSEGEVIREAPFPGRVFDGVAGAWPEVVVNAVVTTPQSVGHPFHVIDIRDGRVVESFGGSATWSRGDWQRLMGRIVLRAADSTLWTVQRNEPVLRQWSIDGEPLQSFDFSSVRFSGVSSGRPGAPDTAPGAQVRGVVVTDSLAVILSAEPRESWRDAWLALRRGTHGERATLPNPSDLYQSYLLVIDISNGEVLQRTSVSFHGVGWSSPQSAIVVADPQVQNGRLTLLRFVKSNQAHRIRR